MFGWFRRLFARREEATEERHESAKGRVLDDCTQTGRVLAGYTDGLGNLYYNEGVYGGYEVVPMDPKDQAMLAYMQHTTVAGMTMPSGFKTPPPPPGCVWRVVKDRLVLMDKANERVAKNIAVWELEGPKQ